MQMEFVPNLFNTTASSFTRGVQEQCINATAPFVMVLPEQLSVNGVQQTHLSSSSGQRWVELVISQAVVCPTLRMRNSNLCTTTAFAGVLNSSTRLSGNIRHLQCLQPDLPPYHCFSVPHLAIDTAVCAIFISFDVPC